MNDGLTSEQIADNELRVKFGLQPKYSGESKKSQIENMDFSGGFSSLRDNRTAELQEYEKGILDVVKSQNALKSSMRARMAASGQSTDQIEKRMAEISQVFSEEVQGMYKRGVGDIKDKFDPYGALKQRADYYEASSGGMAHGDLMEKAKGWKEWW